MAKFLQTFDVDDDPVFINLETGKIDWLLPSSYGVENISYIAHFTDAGVPYYEQIDNGAVSWRLPPEIAGNAKKNANTILKLTCKEAEELIGYPFSSEQSEELMNQLDSYLDALVLENDNDNDDNNNTDSYDENDYNSPPRRSTTAMDSRLSLRGRSSLSSNGKKSLRANDSINDNDEEEEISAKKYSSNSNSSNKVLSIDTTSKKKAPLKTVESMNKTIIKVTKITILSIIRTLYLYLCIVLMFL